MKEDTYRIKWSVGGKIIIYSSNAYTPNADIVTTKLLFKSVILMPNAKFLGIDLKYVYLQTPKEQYKYISVPHKMLSQADINKLNLKFIINNDNIMVEIRKGAYRLPQAGRIVYDKLISHLDKGGYIPTYQTPGLFKYKTRSIIVCLVIDNFGITYEKKQDVDNLLKHFDIEYTATINREGRILSQYMAHKNNSRKTSNKHR